MPILVHVVCASSREELPFLLLWIVVSLFQGGMGRSADECALRSHDCLEVVRESCCHGDSLIVATS